MRKLIALVAPTEILTDKAPFYALTKGAVLIAKQRGEKPNPPDHPGLAADDALWPLLDGCWNAHAGQRPRMSDLHDSLLHHIRDS